MHSVQIQDRAVDTRAKSHDEEIQLVLQKWRQAEQVQLAAAGNSQKLQKEQQFTSKT